MVILLIKDVNEYSDSNNITENVAGHACCFIVCFVGQHLAKVSTATYHSSICREATQIQY